MKQNKKPKYLKPKTLVKVEWGDAWGGSGWTRTIEKDHGLLKVITVGFVEIHDEKGISLGTGWDENGTWNGQHFIPAGMILKVTRL